MALMAKNLNKPVVVHKEEAGYIIKDKDGKLAWKNNRKEEAKPKKESAKERKAREKLEAEALEAAEKEAAEKGE